MTAAPPILKLLVDARPDAVRGALTRVTAGLGAEGVSVEGRDDAELVLAEIMNNIVEHAYADAEDGEIELTIWSERKGLVCEVVDAGRAMPRETLPAGTAAEVDCPRRELPEGGFGWFLIRELTSEICYARDGAKNRLRFFLGSAVSEQQPAA
jgi:serine/threonine-protein kinase RsbW